MLGLPQLDCRQLKNLRPPGDNGIFEKFMFGQGIEERPDPLHPDPRLVFGVLGGICEPPVLHHGDAPEFALVGREEPGRWHEDQDVAVTIPRSLGSFYRDHGLAAPGRTDA